MNMDPKRPEDEEVGWLEFIYALVVGAFIVATLIVMFTTKTSYP